MTQSDVDALGRSLATGYPGFTVEHVYVKWDNSFGGPGATLIPVLKWRGPEDFRITDAYDYGVARRSDSRWTQPHASYFARIDDAKTFIAAFNKAHPKGGLVVGSFVVGRLGERQARSGGMEIRVQRDTRAQIELNGGSSSSLGEQQDDFLFQITDSGPVWTRQGP